VNDSALLFQAVFLSNSERLSLMKCINSQPTKPTHSMRISRRWFMRWVWPALRQHEFTKTEISTYGFARTSIKLFSCIFSCSQFQEKCSCVTAHVTTSIEELYLSCSIIVTLKHNHRGLFFVKKNIKSRFVYSTQPVGVCTHILLEVVCIECTWKWWILQLVDLSLHGGNKEHTDPRKNTRTDMWRK